MGSNFPALDVHTPPDALSEFSRVAGLRGVLQQQQQEQQMAPLRQQQAQQTVDTGAVELQQKQQQLKDQQATTAAMHEWDGKTLDDLPSLILKHGASAQAVFGMKGQILEQKQKLATLDKDTLANTAAKNDNLLGALQGATSGDDAGLGDRIKATALDQVQKGNLDPQHAQQLQQLLTLPPDQLRKTLGLFEKTMQGQKEQFSQAQEQQKTQNEAWKADGQGMLVNVQTGQKIQGQAPVDQSEMKDWLQKNPSKGPAEFMAYKASLVPKMNFSLQNGGAGAGPNGQPSEMAKAIAAKQMKWSDAISPRTPMAVKQDLLKQVKSIDPNFNTGDFAIEQGVKKDFTTGKGAQNLTAFNTAIEHANQLSTAADALNNRDEHTLNAIGNRLGYEFGSDKTTNFNVIKNALSGEISKVFKGGEATDAEIKAVQAPFDAANSPEQLKGAIKQAISLMNSKRDALKQQYQSGMQSKPNFGDNANPPASGGGFWDQFPVHK